MGGRHPEAPSQASGGAATRPASSGAAGEEVSVCEPAAVRAPGPAGGNLAVPGSQVAERRQRFGPYTLPCACAFCLAEKRNRVKRFGWGWPRRGLESQDPSSALPAPGAPDMRTLVLIFLCSLTYCCRHRTVSQEYTRTHMDNTRDPPCIPIVITQVLSAMAEREGTRGAEERVQGTQGGGVWLNGECVEGHGAR